MSFGLKLFYDANLTFGQQVDAIIDVSWLAYESGPMVVISSDSNYGGWGVGHVDLIAAHETMHVFGTSDEYKGKGTPCSACDGSFGCDAVPNGNCAVCSRPHQDCLMDGDVARICAYTQAQVGWADLLVELTTADVLFAGTDDDVWLDIGTRTFVLDMPDVDDRERNNIQAYALKDTGISRADIQRIAIRKSSDGAFGGWDLERVRVWMDGELLCDEDNVNTWLEDNHLVWVCPGFESPPDLVNSLVVKVTTGDVMWAGTDDDVTLKMGGQSWNLDNPDHDDFERGHKDTFTLDPGTGLLRSALSGVHIHKSPDGIAGGWFLKGLEIVVNGATVFNDQSINQWLEDDHRDWRGTI